MSEFAALGKRLHYGRYQAHEVVNCPAQFSFIEAPEDAIQTLAEFARAVVDGAVTIDVRESRCEDIDLCAVATLNALALSARASHKTRLKGDYPANLAAKEIVMATGLPKALGLPLPEQKNFLVFPIVLGRKATDPAEATESSSKEVMTQRLAEYFDKCLRLYGFALDRDGKDYVAKLAGEVITNAEDHSGRRAWWIAGYLRQPEGRDYGDCHLTVFNLGKTLAESLKGLPRSAKLRRDIEELVSLHRRARFLIPSRWTEENLWTLYALQEGVSRRNDQQEFLGHYGFGTIRMIEMFQYLGQTSVAGVEPVMCVVSGRTHIRFDGRYPLGTSTTERAEERRTIAFNPENDLRLPPDATSVRHLPKAFPGTLISLRFYFDRKYLVTVGGPNA